MKKIRVLQILPELNVGGVETGTVDLARYLTSHGHHAVVVSNGGELVQELKKSGITHYSLPVHKKSFLNALHSVKALRQIILEEHIDIVHARSRVPAWIAYFACRGTPAQFLTTCHGYYSHHLLSRIMGWAKIVIVPSEVIGRRMIEAFKTPPENIRCIPRSVDIERFSVPREEKHSEDFVITMVGRITQLKGHTFFLKSMAKVVRNFPLVKIWIVGDAPLHKESYKQELQVMVRRLGMTDHVEFLGNRRDVPQLLAKTDVLVMSSVVPEAFGRVILEAQAAGVPVVATQVGGVVEIIDQGKTGLLVLPKDTEGMADAVLRLLRDRVLARNIVAAAREKLLAHFTLEHMAGRTLAVYRELLDRVNILVIKVSALGDVILVVPSLKALRQKYPKAQICCLVGRDSRKVLQRCPYIDELIVMDNREGDRNLLSLFRLGRKLRRYRFDKVIDFQNNWRTHLLGFLSLARETYGYRKGKSGCLLTTPVKNPEHNLPPVEHQFQVLQMLGISHSPQFTLELWPSSEDEARAAVLLDSEWLGGTSSIVGINIAASAKWQTKNWPVEHIAVLCDFLAAQNIRVLVTGTAHDRPEARRLLTLTKTKPANFTGKTDIMELAALIQRCKVFISPDSAPLHIAAAVNTPFIAFFGPTSSGRHLPAGDSCFVFERNPECAPCYRPQCRLGTHICMKDISPEEVAKAVIQLIEKTTKSA